ncbi:MAG: hypothetical protein BRC23_00690 [Parcubacteria group bacterium SW_4_49_11]|nr:MAG: hypothetical protein BRC23_00690 [Parcubacteria group bacterium SW_4_49_11]
MKGILYILIGFAAGVFLQGEYPILQQADELKKQAEELLNEAGQPTNEQTVSTKPCEKEKVQNLLLRLENIETFNRPNGRGALCENDGSTLHSFFPEGPDNVKRTKAIQEEAETIDAVSIDIDESKNPEEAPWVTVKINQE